MIKSEMSSCFKMNHGVRPEVRLPVSKSIAARFLVASYFSGTLGNVSVIEDCDDIRVIHRALLALDTVRSGKDVGVIDIHASGTALRFMTAVAASVPDVNCVVTGTSRVCVRPMGPMLSVLHDAGGDITPLGENVSGPYRISGRVLEGGEFEIRGDISSQFISALMMSAPFWRRGVRLKFSTPLVSRPYVEMTAAVMTAFGVKVSLYESGVEVLPGRYEAPQDFAMESDWSAAGFFYEAAMLRKEAMLIAGLTPPSDSLQGDSATSFFFDKVGVRSRFFAEGVEIEKEAFGQEADKLSVSGRLDMDLSDNPDLVPAFAVGCAFAGLSFRFSGVCTLRIKECDRLSAIREELFKFGYVIEVGEDSIEWNGCMTEPAEAPVVSTYSDHRIAMAFAMAALKTGEVRVADPDVVDKSFAGFWDELPKIGLICEREGNIMKINQEI